MTSPERVSADSVARHFVRVDPATRAEPDAQNAKTYRDLLAAREGLVADLKPAFARMRGAH